MTEEELYADISDMQAEWNKRFRDKRRWIIVEEGDGNYSIHEHMIDGVAPPITKTNKREVAARFLQCLGVGPVAPQSHPEEICCGLVSMEDTSTRKNDDGVANRQMPISSTILKELERSLPQILYSIKEDGCKILNDYQADMISEIIIGTIKSIGRRLK